MDIQQVFVICIVVHTDYSNDTRKTQTKGITQCIVYGTRDKKSYGKEKSIYKKYQNILKLWLINRNIYFHFYNPGIFFLFSL